MCQCVTRESVGLNWRRRERDDEIRWNRSNTHRQSRHWVTCVGFGTPFPPCWAPWQIGIVESSIYIQKDMDRPVRRYSLILASLWHRQGENNKRMTHSTCQYIHTFGLPTSWPIHTFTESHTHVKYWIFLQFCIALSTRSQSTLHCIFCIWLVDSCAHIDSSVSSVRWERVIWIAGSTLCCSTAVWELKSSRGYSLLPQESERELLLSPVWWGGLGRVPEPCCFMERLHHRQEKVGFQDWAQGFTAVIRHILTHTLTRCRAHTHLCFFFCRQNDESWTAPQTSSKEMLTWMQFHLSNPSLLYLPCYSPWALLPHLSPWRPVKEQSARRTGATTQQDIK